MSRHLDLTAVAHLVGDPSRLKMLAALVAEGELSAGGLAAAAGVSPQTANEHLKRLQWGVVWSRVLTALMGPGTESSAWQTMMWPGQ